LLAQDPRPLVGDFLFLIGRSDGFVAIDLQDAEAGLKAAFAYRQRGLLAGLVTRIPRPSARNTIPSAAVVLPFPLPV